jgi:hypothetical protein
LRGGQQAGRTRLERPERKLRKDLIHHRVEEIRGDVDIRR